MRRTFNVVWALLGVVLMTGSMFMVHASESPPGAPTLSVVAAESFDIAPVETTGCNTEQSVSPLQSNYAGDGFDPITTAIADWFRADDRPGQLMGLYTDVPIRDPEGTLLSAPTITYNPRRPIGHLPSSVGTTLPDDDFGW